MHWSWPRFLVTLLVALLVAAFYWFVIRKKGDTYEETYDRVVEETTDESTKLRTLVEGHDQALRQRDAEVLRLRADHEHELEVLRREHEIDLANEHAETNRLRGLVGELEGATEKARALQAQIVGQKEEYARLEHDWKRRLEESEGRVALEAKRVADAQAGSDRLAADWESRLRAAEQAIAEGRRKLDAANAEHAAAVAQHESALAAHVATIAGHEGQIRTLTSQLAAANDGAAGADDADVVPDDLTEIEGIGPKINAALQADGIRTFRRLARTGEARLRAALDAGGISFAPSMATWAEQAQLLADGDRAGFEALVARLDAGRAPGA